MVNRGATQLARHTAARFLANAILGYKIQAFTKVFAGMVISIISNGLMSKYWSSMKNVLYFDSFFNNVNIICYNWF